MTKEEYIHKIVCKFWFDCIDWHGSQWDDRSKSIWLSGMQEAWNLLNPSEPIGKLEIVTKTVTWSRKEAWEWYRHYVSEDIASTIRIENRWQILDL